MFNGLKKLFGRDSVWAAYRQEAEMFQRFTPDWVNLQILQKVKIFVYNENQLGQPQHGLLGPNATYGGMGYTESSDFVMYKKLLGIETFPFAMEVREDQKHGLSSLIGDMGQVMGEVYALAPIDVVALDNYMLNTVQFERKSVKILIPFKPRGSEDAYEVYPTEAQMYVGRQEFWNEQLKDTEQRKLFSPSKRLFTAKEKEDTLGAYYIFDHKLEASRE